MRRVGAVASVHSCLGRFTESTKLCFCGQTGGGGISGPQTRLVKASATAGNKLKFSLRLIPAPEAIKM